MRVLNLRLPYPPSINSYWRRSQTGIYIAKSGQAYREAVKRVVGQERAAGRLSDPIAGPVAVTILLVLPDRRRRDADNPVKALFDAMTHARVWTDDDQVARFAVTRGEPDPGNACAIVSIRGAA